MKKIFYICLVTFFVTGVSLFYVIDKNYDTIKTKVTKKVSNRNDSEGIIIMGGNEKIETIEKEYGISFKTIKIDINVGELKIEGYNGTNIRIKSLVPKKSLKDYKVNEKSETLEINAGVVHDILIQIPQNLMVNGEIKLGVGDINVENLKNLKIELATGNIEGENVENLLNLKLDLGDLNLKNIKNIHKIEIGTGQGDIEIIEQNNDFLIENHLGDLNVNITNKFQGTVSAKVNLGDSSIENLNTKGDKYKGEVNVSIGELTIAGKD